MPWLLYICIFFSDFMCFDMGLFIIDCYPAGVSNKHCLLPLFFICPEMCSKNFENQFCLKTLLNKDFLYKYNIWKGSNYFPCKILEFIEIF